MYVYIYIYIEAFMFMQIKAKPHLTKGVSASALRPRRRRLTSALLCTSNRHTSVELVSIARYKGVHPTINRFML